MDLEKFWTVSSGILGLYHSSWRTSSSCFRDVGVMESVPHSSLQNRPKWFSVVQILWLCWPGKMLKFTFMLFKPWLNSRAVWMGALSSWKNISFGNNIWNMGFTWLPNLAKYSLAVIRSWMVIMGPTEYNNECPRFITVGSRHFGL
jgi:hypothetical protein